MTESIRVGTMLLKDGTRIPKTLAVSTERYSAGWSFITASTSAQLDTRVENAGWTLFYMAGEIRTRSFGFNELSRTARAVAKVIHVVKRDSCNCLEIIAMRHGSFLGLPYTSLIAHSRHIQRGRRFENPSPMPEREPSRPHELLYDPAPTGESQTVFTAEAAQAWENEGGSRAGSSQPVL
jgi:hypothetical protein